MLIIGCDYHPGVQQIAFVDTETGDYGEHRLKHSDGEAERFYRDLKLRAGERESWARSSCAYSFSIGGMYGILEGMVRIVVR